MRRYGGAWVIAMAAVLVVSLVAPVEAYQRPGRVDRVSVAPDGTQADWAWLESKPYQWQVAFSLRRTALSADGRYVAFESWADNLAPGDTNEASDIFVHDRQAGTIERVSVTSDGKQAVSDRRGYRVGSFVPAISADGRYVAFESSMPNLVSRDINGALDVFVHDRQTGTTERVSVTSDGKQGNGNSGRPAISTDGRFVAFHSDASNVVEGDINGALDVFVHDHQAGTTERVSVSNQGIGGNDTSGLPAISADGRFVAFASRASNLVLGDTNLEVDTFVHNRSSGETERVSVASDGSQASSGGAPAISGDGRFVAFASGSDNLVPGKTAGTADVFVHDRDSGETERVSVASDGTEFELAGWWQPAISADGRYVVFQQALFFPPPGSSSATAARDGTETLGATGMLGLPFGVGEQGDGASSTPVGLDEILYVRDRVTDATELIPGEHGHTPGASLSADGRFVAFESTSSSLVPEDTNEAPDVFVRDRGEPIGLGDVTAATNSRGISVSGRATFSGVVVTSIEDPSPVTSPGIPTGTVLTGASIVYRPEDEDLLVRLNLSSIPSVLPFWTGGAGIPRIVYGMRFSLDGTRYEVRAVRTAQTSEPWTNSSFGLYRCDPQPCVRVAELSGGIGTTGDHVVISMPLAVVAQLAQRDQDTALSSVMAFTALGDSASDSASETDSVNLPDAIIVAPRVTLGTAPPGTTEQDVTFTTEATLTDGSFAANLNVPVGSSDPVEVWARACMGTSCTATKTPLTPTD